METTLPKTSNIAIKWAVIFVLVSIVFTYLFQFLNIDPNSPIKYLTYLFFIAFLLLAQKEYKDQAGGFITFGQGFLEGFLFAVYSGLMLAVFMFIYLKYLSPQVFEQSMAAQREKLEAQGTMSKDQVDNAMNIASKYGAVIAAVATIFIMPIFGAIVSLIGAAIFKKERTFLDIENNSNYTDPVQ